MEVLAEKNPTWLQWISPSKFDDKELFRIVTFFVFHSPCDGLSAMGKSLKQYGWSNPWNKPFYLNKQLKQVVNNPNLLASAKKYSEMDICLEKVNLKDNFPYDLSTERICIYDSKENQFLSIFCHLRNAFAHCRLNMVDVDGECVFILEDVVHNKKQLKISARMILKKSTLLKWIDIIEDGEKEYIKHT